MQIGRFGLAAYLLNIPPGASQKNSGIPSPTAASGHYQSREIGIRPEFSRNFGLPPEYPDCGFSLCLRGFDGSVDPDLDNATFQLISCIV